MFRRSLAKLRTNIASTSLIMLSATSLSKSIPVECDIPYNRDQYEVSSIDDFVRLNSVDPHQIVAYSLNDRNHSGRIGV